VRCRRTQMGSPLGGTRSSAREPNPGVLWSTMTAVLKSTCMGREDADAVEMEKIADSGTGGLENRGSGILRVGVSGELEVRMRVDRSPKSVSSS